MHEASLIQSVIEICAAHLDKSGYSKVDCVSLRIGTATGVVPECLQFAFDAIKPGTPFEDARLLVEQVPLGGDCAACGKSFEVDEKYILSCPLCGASGVRLTQGRELDITEIEVS